MINPSVYRRIMEYIRSYLAEHGSATIEDLLRNYRESTPISEFELKRVVTTGIEEGYLKVEKNAIDKYSNLISQIKIYQPEELLNSVVVVISKPRLRELSLSGIEYRNQFIETTECFQQVISSAHRVLRICSPFLQKDVIQEDAYPELEHHLSEALLRGVKIRILTRELIERRYAEVSWIKELARALELENSVTIVDYHHTSDTGKVVSSTHAKMLIADSGVAYIGSAEFRRNSLIANFEVGCLLSGPVVFGLCEVFDSMYSNGRVIL
ncbi:phospholipase D-like domain-containing protein [Methanoculleus sediminis]|uniref:phospholipase D-like domain-containing protein n=1 Tax=Methanoculleus sediminis TaxID=1550566 RepID=UPI0009E472FC|nr:phospholipase D family protein [Methanoculleus sediminis]